jgi:hypothetical protein
MALSLLWRASIEVLPDIPSQRQMLLSGFRWVWSFSVGRGPNLN